MLMQYETFGLFGDAPLAEIAQCLGVGRQMARQHVKKLEQLGIVRKAHARTPLTFMLTEDFKQRYEVRAIDWQALSETE